MVNEAVVELYVNVPLISFVLRDLAKARANLTVRPIDNRLLLTHQAAYYCLAFDPI